MSPSIGWVWHMKALDQAQAESQLPADEASQLAYDELRALRHERRGAA